MTDEECRILPHVKECIDTDSLGFWIPFCALRIEDSTSKNFPDFLTWGTKWYTLYSCLSQAPTSLNKQRMSTLPGMWHRSNPFSLKNNNKMNTGTVKVPYNRHTLGRNEVAVGEILKQQRKYLLGCTVVYRWPLAPRVQM